MTYAICPTHPDDFSDDEARAAPPWLERGPKWQPFGQRGQALAALRHEDGRARVATVPDGMEPQELADDGWEVVAVIEPLQPVGHPTGSYLAKREPDNYPTSQLTRWGRRR